MRRAARAERAADRDLALARRRAREQEVRDVRRRNEQQEADRAEQHVQDLAHVADDGVLQRHRVERPVFRRRILPLEAGGDGVEVRPQLGDRRRQA